MIASIAGRLTDVVSELKLVGGAAQFEKAVQGLTTLPAAFVLPASDAAGENPFMGQMVQQRVSNDFTIALAVRNLADAAGAAALDVLGPVRVAVRDALLNWVPNGADEGCTYRSGRLVAFAGGVLWWEDTYATAYTIRSVQ